MNSTAAQIEDVEQRATTTGGLSFLWLELTNRCNLNCVHCYSDSSPYSGDNDRLESKDYRALIAQAAELGCRKVQFIGGEPLLNPDIIEFLNSALEAGYEQIEVYSNLTRLGTPLIEFAKANSIRFATSFYSHKADVHNTVTQSRSSHARTLSAIKTLVRSGVQLRVGIIVMKDNESDVDDTIRFLTDLGVSEIGIDHARPFGRGKHRGTQPKSMAGLCGHCWDGNLCVAPDGAAYPCIMSRDWPVGNVLSETLLDVIKGQRLRDTRTTIKEQVWRPKATHARNTGSPESDPCRPCQPSDPLPCGPDKPCRPDLKVS